MRAAIQILLIIAVVAVVLRLVSNRGDRTKAMRRIGMMLFALFAAYSIVFPATWTAMARFVGVGRGTDLLLYVLVVAFLAFTMNTYLRFRDMETRYTRLARRIALDEAQLNYPEVASPGRPDAEGDSPSRDGTH